MLVSFLFIFTVFSSAFAFLPPVLQRLRTALPTVFQDDVLQKRKTTLTIPAFSNPKALPTVDIQKRATQFTVPTFSNPKAEAFHVNSSDLPLVTFPLQDSWSGQLPISSSASETRKLFFWYWPSSASNGSETLTIWLNGGPGCSSLEGFLEENGPITMEPGTTVPSINPYAWTSVSDMLYIDQPVGNGFTVGTPNITDESQLSDEFYGFLQQFYGVFSELSSKPLYITGESYAGFYIPYIATRIVNASAAEKESLSLALQGLLINDGVYSSSITNQQAPAARFAEQYQSILGLTESQVSGLVNTSQSPACGYETLMNQITYPPSGKINLPNGNRDFVPSGCDVFDDLLTYANEANPCFNIYRITDKCPTPNDTIASYFSRPDVQTAINVPGFGLWIECSSMAFAGDGQDNSAYSEMLLPNLIATLPKGVTLWHGLDDSILFSEGDRLTIQNMTWNGAQGFSTEPSTPLLLNGQQIGIYHSERALTYLEVNNSGHMIPQSQPALALHVFSSVLGLATLNNGTTTSSTAAPTQSTATSTQSSAAAAAKVGSLDFAGLFGVVGAALFATL